MKPANDLLRAWIKRQGFKTQREAARFIGVHEMVLSSLLSASRFPGLATATRIEDKTGIPAKSWQLSKLSKSKATRSKKTDNAA